MRLPGGLIFAGLWLFVFECLLRFTTAGTLPGGPDDRELAYRRLVPDLIARGAPSVSIVGSSRAREGVNAPALRKALGVEVGNFGLGGATAEEVDIVIARLVEAEPRPSLVVWAATPRDLITRGRPGQHMGYLWRIEDWWEARSVLEGRADALLPDAIRNELANGLYVMRYRFGIRALLDSERNDSWSRGLQALFLQFPKVRSPMRGDASFVQRGATRNLSRPVEHQATVRYLRDRHREPEWPNTYQVEHVERAVQRLAAAGVPLVFAEVPLHPTLIAAYPPNTVAGFRQVFQRIADEHGIAFVRFDELGVSFELDDFRDHSHLNLRGARKFSKALAPRLRSLLAPSLRAWSEPR